jgi:DNA anti-recombination protein RmuC
MIRPVFLSVALAGIALAVGCGKVQEAADKAKEIAEVAKMVDEFKGTVDKDLKPIDAKIQEAQDKVSKVTGEEKTQLEGLLKEIGPIRDSLTTKLGGLTNIKDIESLKKLKDDVMAILTQLKDKLGIK